MKKTLGIAIPTYDNHISYLKELLDTIADSSVLPNQVSISTSSYKGGEPDISNYPFEIIFTSTEDLKNAAQNRNIAASKLTTDVISFIDGDDLPHIKRNEFILNYFEKNYLPLVHSYVKIKTTEEKIKYVKKTIEIYDTSVGIINHIPKDSIQSMPMDQIITFHNAHISLLKKDFDVFKYDESDISIRKEDTLYTKKLVENGIFISYTPTELTVYNK